MENAAKALLIAGGVMLALLTISVFVYMTNNLSKIKYAQDNKTVVEQLGEFNAQYEAYNKKFMYGADVCTLLNKVIEYNGGLNATGHMYFIDIELTVNKDFKTVKITKDKNSGEITNEPVGNSSLNSGTYNLKASGNSMNSTLVSFFNSDIKIEQEIIDDKEITQYNAISDFRKTIFSCDSIEYSEKTGQVNKITLSQKQESTY